MKRKLRLGIYGGTFSPPHIGHVNSAKDFMAEMKLDKLLIIPDNLPPHKFFAGEASAEERLEMARLAFSGIDGCEVSDIEIRRGGKSYTYLTLEELSREDVELFFLCGTDMFLTLSEWRRPERIFELATICFVRRECDGELGERIKLLKEKYRTEYSARIIEISHKVEEVSSTALREKLKAREGVEALIPSAVYNYIIERGLYL